jgi:hypothetical protein
VLGAEDGFRNYTNKSTPCEETSGTLETNDYHPKPLPIPITHKSCTNKYWQFLTKTQIQSFNLMDKNTHQKPEA